MGFAIGLLAAGLVSQGAFLSGLLAAGASRLCEALDGAVARHAQPTDLGGFLDITLDFVFYASIPLAFAVIAAKRGLHHLAVPDKSFYFLGGLTEGTETLAFFCRLLPVTALLCAFGLWFFGPVRPHPRLQSGVGSARLCQCAFGRGLGWFGLPPYPPNPLSTPAG